MSGGSPLALVVTLRGLKGDEDLAERAGGMWALAQVTARAVQLLVAVRDGLIAGAWDASVDEVDVQRADGGRKVTRVSFALSDRPELAALIGLPTPVPPQRNPVALLPVSRFERLVGIAGDGGDVCSVSLSGFVLSVDEHGDATVVAPRDASVTVLQAGHRNAS